MNFTTKLLLLIAGIFGGIWLAGQTTVAPGTALIIAIIALALAITLEPHNSDHASSARLETAYNRWLDTWRERGRSEDLNSAHHALLISANDRVVRALTKAAADNVSLDSVVALVLEMRRSLGRSSLAVQHSDIAALLTDAPRIAPERTRPVVTPASSTRPPSFFG